VKSASPPRIVEDHGNRGSLAILSLATVGVVYGDIGTSPLYALRECFQGAHHAIEPTAANILGVLSLIFWSLVLVISIKYLVFILRADNEGEGGILALTALITRVHARTESRRWLIVTFGLFGAALLYADGMITPAISVLSAVEGFEVATPVFKPYTQLITTAILVGLFFFQSRGTARVGSVFGPVTLAWFLAMAAIGVPHIVREPSVLWALNPIQAIELFWFNGWDGFLILGTVFLVVTGGEALYADLGHFGARPIRFVWFAVVLPALLLNYFGQGAYLIARPAGETNPFFQMAPPWALYPLAILATTATAIASQAIITGAFSLTLQAIQLGYSPRLKIEHTSPELIGQIYIPFVNWMLMAASIGLVLGFRTSSNLAAAYGVAITITMVITTLLFGALARERWKWSWPLVLSVSGIFLAADLAFFGANIIKIAKGGWFPLVVAAIGYTVMSTWMAGRRLLAHRLRTRLIPVDLYLAELLSDLPTRVPGVAVFMSGNPIGTPPALRHNVSHNHVLHKTVIILTVETAEVPRIRTRDRAEIEDIGEGFYGIKIKYGFMDKPNVPQELKRLKLPFAESEVSYFLGRERLLSTSNTGLSRWREHLFIMMSQHAQRATDFFGLPAERVIEIGVQVEL
jgi:KUP system potassium uptake protein